MQSKDSMRSQKFNINTVQLPYHTTYPVKQQKGKGVTILFKDYTYLPRCFELESSPHLHLPLHRHLDLICLVCCMQCTNQNWRFGFGNLQQPSQSLATYLPGKFKLYYASDFIIAKKKVF